MYLHNEKLVCDGSLETRPIWKCTALPDRLAAPALLLRQTLGFSFTDSQHNLEFFFQLWRHRDVTRTVVSSFGSRSASPGRRCADPRPLELSVPQDCLLSQGTIAGGLFMLSLAGGRGQVLSLWCFAKCNFPFLLMKPYFCRLDTWRWFPCRSVCECCQSIIKPTSFQKYAFVARQWLSSIIQSAFQSLQLPCWLLVSEFE